MDEIIKKILEWPVIIQGALGSGLFWLILLIGQRIASDLSGSFLKNSNKNRKNSLLVEKYKYQAMKNEAFRSEALLMIFYKASQYFINGLVWLTLGLLTSSIIPVFGVVGYIGALYYFFIVMKMFRPVPVEIDAQKRINEIDAELGKVK